MVDGSAIVRDLRERRNMRLAFKSGFYLGGIEAGLMTLTGGAFPGGRIESRRTRTRPSGVEAGEPFTPDGKLTFAKVDAVFKAGQRDARRHPVAPDRRHGRAARRSRDASTGTCARRACTSAAATGWW